MKKIQGAGVGEARGQKNESQGAGGGDVRWPEESEGCERESRGQEEESQKVRRKIVKGAGGGYSRRPESEI